MPFRTASSRQCPLSPLATSIPPCCQHRDVKATDCPGENFPLARLKADVKRLMALQ